jgi:uncharacterized delta-60 repeat protein
MLRTAKKGDDMNQKWLRRTAVPIIVTCIGLANCSSNNTTTTQGPTTAYAVLRLKTSDGTPDTSFAGGRGIALTDVDPALFDFALAVAIEPPPSNKILAAGSSGLAGQGVIALVRYNADGTLDTTGFGTAGTGGIVKTPLPSVASSAQAIAVQPDGKILVAALTFTAVTDTTATTGIALLRYNPDGTLDKTGFNAGQGFVTATIGPGLVTDTCALGLQSDGKIVVAGASQSGDIVLYRYTAAGALDTLTFGANGTSGTTVITLPTTGARSPAIAFQSDGRIILVSGTTSDQVVLRLGTDGKLDTSFGGVAAPGGIVKTDIGGVNYANAVAVQQVAGSPALSDKIVVAGHANFGENTSDISLVRYNADGTLDTTFNALDTIPGTVITDIASAGRFDNALAIALQDQSPAEPKIVVAGNTGAGGFTQIAVLRYMPDGSPDMNFGVNGVVVVNLAGPSNIASGNAVALQPVGTGVGIVVAGYD